MFTIISGYIVIALGAGLLFVEAYVRIKTARAADTSIAAIRESGLNIARSISADAQVAAARRSSRSPSHTAVVDVTTSTAAEAVETTASSVLDLIGGIAAKNPLLGAGLLLVVIGLAISQGVDVEVVFSTSTQV